jgi:hypothetical protein
MIKNNPTNKKRMCGISAGEGHRLSVIHCIRISSFANPTLTTTAKRRRMKSARFVANFDWTGAVVAEGVVVGMGNLYLANRR